MSVARNGGTRASDAAGIVVTDCRAGFGALTDGVAPGRGRGVLRRAHALRRLVADGVSDGPTALDVAARRPAGGDVARRGGEAPLRGGRGVGPLLGTCPRNAGPPREPPGSV